MPIEVVGLVDSSASIRLSAPFVQFTRTRHTLHFLNGLELVDQFIITGERDLFLREGFRLSPKGTQLIRMWGNLHPGSRVHANGIVSGVANCYDFQRGIISDLGEKALVQASKSKAYSVINNAPKAVNLAQAVSLTTRVQTVCLEGARTALGGGVSEAEVAALEEAESVLISIGEFFSKHSLGTVLVIAGVFVGGLYLFNFRA